MLCWCWCNWYSSRCNYRLGRSLMRHGVGKVAVRGFARRSRCNGICCAGGIFAYWRSLLRAGFALTTATAIAAIAVAALALTAFAVIALTFTACAFGQGGCRHGRGCRCGGVCNWSIVHRRCA